MSANANQIVWEPKVTTPNTGQIWNTDPAPTAVCAPGVVTVPEQPITKAPDRRP